VMRMVVCPFAFKGESPLRIDVDLWIVSRFCCDSKRMGGNSSRRHVGSLL
jgi:hypothetical protein